MRAYSSLSLLYVKVLVILNLVISALSATTREQVRIDILKERERLQNWKEVKNPFEGFLPGPTFSLRPQPLFDRMNIPKVFTDRKYMEFCVACLSFNGPCDIIGKFLKPRAMTAVFQGRCLACTKYQEAHIQEWLLLLIDLHPDLFKFVLIKILSILDIPVPEDSMEGYTEFVNSIK